MQRQYTLNTAYNDRSVLTAHTQRQYTLNIDGLSEVVGMDTWHHENHVSGVTVELHGGCPCVC